MGQSRMPWQAGAGGLIGGGLGQMFGRWKNPADTAQGYLGDIPGKIGPYYDPYIQAGQKMLPGMEDEYSKMMSDPGSRLNQIGAGYQQSPGFKFALQQAMQGAGNAAAAGGMAGSPQHEQQNMGIATGMANQDYNQWLQNALGLHGQGLQGAQGLYGTGYDASKSMADQIAQMLAQQAQYGYAGQYGENQHEASGLGSLLGGLGALGGMYFGGPWGAAAGNAAGQAIGGM